MPTKSPANRTAAKKAAPVRKAAPVKKAAPAKKVAPAKKAPPVRKAAPVKKAVPAKKVAQAKKAAPVKRAAAGPVTVAPVKGKATRKSEFRIYVIRVRRITSKAKFDYYVGSTSLSLEEKWERYRTLSTRRLSVYFTRKDVEAIEYMHDLMKGWGPYESKDLALLAEGELALHLQDKGYLTYSEELKRAETRRQESGIVFEVPVWNSGAHKKMAKEATRRREEEKKAPAGKSRASRE